MSGGARDARIHELLPLVKQLARRVHRMVPTADVDDLIGDGSVGMIRAVDSFDPALGVPLDHYARRIVLGAMLNGIRRLDPVSERVRRTIRVAERARFALALDLDALPTAQAMEAHVPGLARARIEAHRGSPLSLDVTLPLGERLEVDHHGDPQVIAAARLERERIRVAVEALPPRQRSIIEAHYFDERSLRSLHASLGISPQRVSQLHLIAVKHLRSVLAESA